MADVVRIDKYLWAIRAYKTRSDATAACKGNKVKVNDVTAKPSKLVETGDIIQFRKGPVNYRYKVLKPATHRVGAKLVPDLAKNITPQSEVDKLNVPREVVFMQRDRGAGRPTKKDRRQLEELWQNMDMSGAELEFDDEVDLYAGMDDSYSDSTVEDDINLDFNSFDDFA